ncbi:hypothetical protein GCM10009678_28390 [Actinomadura kijaniata]|uniref:Uncharacterized protein n=1 Tax=Actinomadura namibiensis TaxID=182080 RepID=A0A7W3LJX3_ACTNM|nr:hypothetical protein [Actinomadura namibiensis]MBA8949442.1 hypothetical protein [Actinomadura namibiensis]
MTADDHAAEVEALARRYPGWTIWFGLFTGHWWALPPRDRDVGRFIEAPTPQRLIARIEVVLHDGYGQELIDGDPGRSSPSTRTDARRPSNLLRIEGVTPPPFRRVPVVAWPGSTAR